MCPLSDKFGPTRRHRLWAVSPMTFGDVLGLGPGHTAAMATASKPRRAALHPRGALPLQASFQGYAPEQVALDSTLVDSLRRCPNIGH